MSNIPIVVVPGNIEVEAASGVFGPDHFLLYLTLREKRAVAEVVMSNPTVIALRANEGTLRAARDGDSYEKIDLSAKDTQVLFPPGWAVEASVSRYTCQVVGVRTPSDLPLVSVPFTVTSDEDEAVQIVCNPA